METKGKETGANPLHDRLREEIARARRAEEAAERALAEVRTVRRRLEVLERGARTESDVPRYASPTKRSPAPVPPTAPPPLRPWGHRDGPGAGLPGETVRRGENGSAVVSERAPEPTPSEAPPVAPEDGPGGGEEARLPWMRLLVGVVVVSVVAGATGWLAWQGGLLEQGSGTPEAPAVAEPGPVDGGGTEVLSPPRAPADGGATTEAAESPAASPAPDDAPVLADLPDTPEARAALYDSLWTARSDLFDPLLGRLDEASENGDVQAAVADWRAGEELDPLAADRLHSALLQLVVGEWTGADLSLDGAVLRNPCRGESCTAFLDLWKADGAHLGLGEPPEDAARNGPALAAAERSLLLRALRPSAGEG